MQKCSMSCPGTVRYGAAGDRDREAVGVRQVPIVREGGEGDSDEKGDDDEIVTTPASVVEDRSGPSSLSSDTSEETGRRRGEEVNAVNVDRKSLLSLYCSA